MRMHRHWSLPAVAAVLSIATSAGPARAAEKDFYTKAPEQAEFTPEELTDAKNHPEIFRAESHRILVLGEAKYLPKVDLSQLPSAVSEVVDIGKIINIALKVWDVIRANAPVVDISKDYANAIPEGASWSKMAGWKPPEGKEYAFKSVNKFGMTVVEVKYQVLRTWGGGYVGADGVRRGRYLKAVTIQPLNVYVAWGYRFSMKVTVPDVGNASETITDPIAAMTVNVNWTIDTPLQHQQGTGIYYVQGDGMYREIGGPFKREGVDATETRLHSLRSAILRAPDWQKVFR